MSNLYNSDVLFVCFYYITKTKKQYQYATISTKFDILKSTRGVDHVDYY